MLEKILNKRICLLAISFMTALMGGGFSTTALSASQSVVPVVVDTDLGFDDWIGLVILLDDPAVRVKAIVVSGTGEIHLWPGVRSLKQFLALLGRTDVPIAPGLAQPLKYHYQFPAELRQHADGLMQHVISSYHFSRRSPSTAHKVHVSVNGIALLDEIIKHSATPVTIVAKGPATDIAYLLSRHPDVKQSIKKVIVMGGAIHTAGNLFITGIHTHPMNKKAEWNIFVDVLAAKRLLNSHVPIVLVPLDATNMAHITQQFIDALPQFQQFKSCIGLQLIYAILHYLSLSQPVDGNLFFWDLVPAMMATPEPINWVSTQHARVKVFTNNKYKAMFGATRAYPCKSTQPCVQIVTHLDNEKFNNDLMHRLHRLPKEL